MKLVINKGVRDTMQELERLHDQLDAITSSLSKPDASFSNAMNDGLEKQSIERTILGACARMLSHATKGKRYPLMTERFYGDS
jgi:hypothetical protein